MGETPMAHRPDSRAGRPCHSEVGPKPRGMGVSPRSERVDGAFADGEAGFLDGFAHRRVRVDRATKAAVFHVRHDLAVQFAGAVPEDLRAEDLVGLRIGDDLHVTVGGVGGDGAAVGGEVELADVDRDACSFRAVFAEEWTATKEQASGVRL